MAKCGGCGIEGKVTKAWRCRGAYWKRCPECVTAWKQERQHDLRQTEDMMLIHGEPTKMGWNGIPSDRSLRKRT